MKEDGVEEGGDMMNVKKIVFTVFLSLLCAIIQAQILTDSNLPIVVIETDGGVPIPDEPRVMGTMKIIWHQDGSRNYLSDINNPAYLNYDGRISIEVRGSTSQQFFDKKPYGLTTLQADNVTNNNVSLLGMPKENDWILNSLAFDQTGLRDVLSYELFERLGQYAVRRVYCEVMVNGDYKGLYVFMEKIKVDDDRVNIAKMDDSCNNYPEVSGGYITKADKPNGDPVAWSMEEYGYGWWPYYTDFIHHYPKPENVTLAQNDYIHGVFTNLATVANRHDTSISTGIPSVIDIPSFVDFMLVAEYSSNVDVYSLSTFFHKDRNGKLRAGPVWDYNLTYGYDAFGSRSRYDVWQFNNQDNNGPKFWRDLFNTDLYRCYLARRWFEQTAPGMPLSYEFVCNRMDEIEALITEAIGRDNQRWHNMTQHDQWMGDMKNWIQLRINWLNQNIGPYEGCADVDMPPLVISKIHYHPQDYWDIDGDRLEFIEITNNGDEEVDLTGVYFRELGVTFSFPDHAQVGGHEALVLCSDSLAFRDYYNTLPFGQFTRNLSNKSENLVLADAWGNVIDEVHYYDSAPWPWEADGDGPYLELIDLNLDNSLPESWTVGYDLTGLDDRHDAAMGLYPNPTRDVLHVDLAETAVRCQLIAVTGNVVQETSAVAQHYDLDLSPLPSGLFVVKVQLGNGKTVFRKVVKQ